MISYWKFLDFDRTLLDQTAGNAKIQKKDYNEKGLLPIIDQGQEYAAGFTDNVDLSFKGELPVILFGDHTRIIKYINERFCLGADGVRVLKPKNYYDAKFLYYYLNFSGIPSKGYSRHFKFLKEKQFPYLALSEQRRIVEILDQVDEIRKLRKQADEKAEKIIPALFYEMFGDIATNSKNWNRKSLSKMCIEVKQTVSSNEGNDLAYLGLENIESNTGNILITEDDAKNNKIIGTSFLFNHNNILFGKLRPYLNKVALPDFSGKCSTELVPLLPLEEYTREFLATILRSKFVVDSLMLKNKGAQMPRADMKYLMNLEIIDPDKKLISLFSNYYREIQNFSINRIKAKKRIEETFSVFLSKAFNGSLTSSWREAHLKELLKEMEEQKKYLEKVK